jgi:outer membrane protein assembly factor BamB
MTAYSSGVAAACDPRHPRRLALMLLCGLTACGGGGSSSALPAATPVASAIGPAPTLTVPYTLGASGDDWTTFAHDQLRSGYQAQSIGVTALNVGLLHLKWTAHLGAPFYSSPLAVGGALYVVSNTGIATALDAATGSIRWQTALGGSVLMTPALDGTTLIVGTHDTPSRLFALDTGSGSIKWSVPFTGPIRSEPVITNGLIVVGTAGGDPPPAGHCLQGGAFGVNETTGAVRWKWFVSPVAANGGSVWSPISFDGTNLFMGTGNTCSDNSVGTANSVVSLTTTGALRWQHNAADPITDDDFGGGVLINNGTTYATNKNGTFLALNASSGSTYVNKTLSTLNGWGGWGTPSTDGKVIVASAGFTSSPTQVPTNPGGSIVGLDPTGAVLWRVKSNYAYVGSVALNAGIAYATLDSTVQALDERTGSVLWSYPAQAMFYASPVVVPSGIYAADRGGNVYAFNE